MIAAPPNVGVRQAAVQGVQAQLAAKKAYTITELEPLDAQAAADIAKRVQAAQAEAGGRNLRTAGGNVVGLEGPPAPKRVGLTEWDSLREGRLGLTLARSVTRRSRPSADMQSK